jgi:D-glycero-D-manno-heptose 1,7-bisphosphate phosphatase
MLSASMLPKSVFLDKDGTLIENVPYNVDSALIRLTDGALESLSKLHAAGFRLIIVSNQAGVAHGKFKEDELQKVEAHLGQLLAEAGIPLSGFYYCPHHPDGKVAAYSVSCFCRKPNPGLLFQAAREHNLNLAGSWIIGDILHDIEAGRRADCRTILIDNGNETEWRLSPLRQPHATVPNLIEAANVILAGDEPVKTWAVKKVPLKATMGARSISIK